MNHRMVVVAAMAALMLFSGPGLGCKKDDSVNVRPTGVRLLDADGGPLAANVLDIGHPSRVELTIRSSSRVRNLAVHFYIIDRAGFDADPDDVTVPQFLIGDASIDLVAKGERAYVFEVPVPYTDNDFEQEIDEMTGELLEPVYYGGVPLIPMREYYLFAQLDPADELDETNEEDNRPSLEGFAGQTLVAYLSNEKRDDPNVYLEDVVLDLDLRMVDTSQLDPEPPPTSPAFCEETSDADPFDGLLDNFGNTQLGLSAVLSATGAYIPDAPAPPEPPVILPASAAVVALPQPIPRVDLEAVFHWEGNSGETWDIPVLLWDSEAEAYARTLSVYQLRPGVPRTIHVDLRLDATLDPSIAAQLADLRDYIFGALPLCIEPGTTCGLDVQACSSVATLEQCLLTADLACAYDCFTREAGTGSVEVAVTAWDSEAGGSPLPGVDLPGFVFESTDELPELHVTPPPLASAAGELCGGFQCPPPSGSQRFETSFSQDFSSGAVGKLAGARVDFDAMAALDPLGASASVNGAARLTLFGFAFDVLGIAASGGVSPVDTSGSYFELALRSDFASTSDRILFAKEMAPCGEGGVTVNAADLAWEVFSKRAEQECKQDCGGNLQCQDACESLVRSFDQSKDVNRTFFISVVPVTATFSAGAALGFSTGIGLPECNDQSAGLFQAHAGPYTEVDSEVSAGIGIGGLFSVGAAAEATLVEDTFFARAQVVDLGLDLGQNQLYGTLGEDVVNTLTGPNGGGYLFARYPCGLKWCGWHPCIKTCTARKNLFHFETFEKKDVLFCDSQDIEVNL